MVSNRPILQVVPPMSTPNPYFFTCHALLIIILNNHYFTTCPHRLQQKDDDSGDGPPDNPDDADDLPEDDGETDENYKVERKNYFYVYETVITASNYIRSADCLCFCFRQTGRKGTYPCRSV